MNFKAFLNEMPIGTFQNIGKWNKSARQYGYGKKDIGILTNPKAVEKIKRQWFNTEEQFDFYFLRSEEGSQYQEVGEVTLDFLRDNLKIELQPNPEAITVVFTNNTGTEKIPMTGWMMAHRFGHAIRRTKDWTHFHNEFMHQWKTIMEDVYNFQARLNGSFGGDGRYMPDDGYRTGIGYGVGQQYNKTRSTEKAFETLAFALGTMKSAQTKKLLNVYEFLYELLAQYLIQGGIKFNPLPPTLLVSKGGFGRPYVAHRSDMNRQELDDFNEYLQGVAEQLDYYLGQVVGGLVGRIFVM